MPASESQYDFLRAAIQSRADTEGSKTARITFGEPGDWVDLGRGIGREGTGGAWESSEGIGPMEMFIRGVADGIVDLIRQTTDPIGTIKMWAGTIGSIPTGWSICNGGNGTPDLRDKFILGSDAAGGSGGSNVTSQPTPSVTGTPNSTIHPTSLVAGTILAPGDHTHNMPHTHTHTPPYYRLIFIMRTTT
jgi:hypothetical protein